MQSQNPVWQLFERLQKLGFTYCPNVYLEEDGDLCFEWDIESFNVISVSISKEGRVGWAALIGDYKSHGHFILPDWNSELDEAFKKLGESNA